jgi:putative membrane protein
VDDHEQARPRGQGREWKLWAAIVALVLLVVFVVQNSQEVEVDFLFTNTTTPLIFALLISALLGALIAWLLPRVRRGGRRE